MGSFFSKSGSHGCNTDMGPFVRHPGPFARGNMRYISTAAVPGLIIVGLACNTPPNVKRCGSEARERAGERVSDDYSMIGR